MNGLGVLSYFRALAHTAGPSLRVIGMAYTGLIGVVGVGLVVSVAFLPVGPALQQATQPAREAVGAMVQPATDVVSSLVGMNVAPEPLLHFMPPPHSAMASGLTQVPAIVVDVAVAAVEDEPPIVVDEPPTQTRSIPIVAASLRALPAPAPTETAVEDVPVEEPDQAVDGTQRAPVQPVIMEVLAESPVQQAANAEAPRALPTPVPTETAWQAKARLDAANQAAIDAAKAAVVRRKADADVANQAAIDARKLAAVTVVPTASSTEGAKPAPSPTPTAPPAPSATAVPAATLATTAVERPVVVAPIPASPAVVYEPLMEQDEAPIMLAKAAISR